MKSLLPLFHRGEISFAFMSSGCPNCFWSFSFIAEGETNFLFNPCSSVCFRGKQLHDGIIEPKANLFNSCLGCLIWIIFYKRAGVSFRTLFPAFLGSGAHFLFRNIDLHYPFIVWIKVGTQSRSISKKLPMHQRPGKWTSVRSGEQPPERGNPHPDCDLFPNL